MSEAGAQHASVPTPLNVLLFIDGLGSGGAQRQFSHLARGLASRGHRVTVAVYNDQDHFAADIAAAGVAIIRLAKPSRFSPRPIIALGKLYRRVSADLVIAFLRSPAAKAELARLMHPGMKVIAAERSAYPSYLSLTFRLTQRLHRVARYVTVNSKSQERAMKRELPRLSGRIVTIRNGVDLPATILRPASCTPAELRLVAVSSLMPYKNSLRLAEALAILRDDWDLRVTVSWLGETFENIAGYGAYHQTHERIRELGLEEQWHWLGVRQNVSSVLAQYDALIHPSLFEGTSNAVCEAMALGLPVLAGDIADHDEMIARSKAGILFDPLDTASIVAAIAQFASLDSTARSNMGRNGRRVIENDYSFERMITEYERLARAVARGDKYPPGRLPSHDERSGACAA